MREESREAARNSDNKWWTSFHETEMRAPVDHIKRGYSSSPPDLAAGVLLKSGRNFVCAVIVAEIVRFWTV